jgi:polysaccharide biosynthesis protein PslH
LRILWLSHLIPYPPKGGVLQRSHHLLCELAKYHGVDLLAFNQVPLMRPLFPTVEAGMAEASEFFRNVGVRHRFISTPHGDGSWERSVLAARSLIGIPYNLRWLQSFEYERALRSWLAEQPYDLIHFDTISLYPYFRFVPIESATALDHHNIESSMLVRRASNERNPAKRLYFLQEGHRLRRVERKVCPKFTTNITCSDVDTSDLKRVAPECRVQTIPNPVDTDYFSPGLEDRQPRLIFVGRLNWYPNVQAVRFIVAKLWPAVKRVWPTIEFDLVGAHPPEISLAMSQRDRNFRVHGFVPDVRPLLARASIYVCPIRDGGGTKVKVLDAMAMGKALIAHPVACEGISVSSGENVLFAESADEYVMHIGALLGDDEYRRRLGRGARSLVEQRYGASAIGRDLARLYESIRFEGGTD